MSERLSTGLVNARNVTHCMKNLMANGVIHIYSGVQPTTADDEEVGVLLMVLTVNSAAFVPGIATNGLNMGLSVDGVLSKSTSEIWGGIGLPAAGSGVVAGWFRWYDNNRILGASTTAIRMDGSIGASTVYEMQMSNTTVVADGPSTVSSFSYTQTRA